MYDFTKLPNDKRKEFEDLYKRGEKSKCFDMIREFGVSDICVTCYNLYELEMNVKIAVRAGIFTNEIINNNRCYVN